MINTLLPRLRKSERLNRLYEKVLEIREYELEKSRKGENFLFEENLKLRMELEMMGVK